MKRPNTRRMQKHAARSASDRASRTFELTPETSALDEAPGFKEWVEAFTRKMQAKHGHKPKIGISTMMVQGDRWSHEVVVDLSYGGPKPETNNSFVDLVKLGEITVEEANRRMRQIMWNGC